MKKNFAFNILNTILTYAFSIILVMYASRTLGPDSMGRVDFSTSVVSYFVLLSGLGLPLYGMRKCASVRDNRQLLSSTVKELLYISLSITLLSVLLLWTLCSLSPRLKQDANIIYILSTEIIFQAIGCEWLYKALEQFKQLAIRDIIIKCITLVLFILFIKSPSNYFMYAVLMAASAALTYLYNFLRLSKYIDFKEPVNKDSFYSHFKPLLIFFFMCCATQIYANIDLVMLGFMCENSTVGGYGIVEKIKNLLTVTGTLIWTVCLPKATSYWETKQTSQLERLSRDCLRIVMFIQTPVMILTLMLCKPILRFAGGEDYIFAYSALFVIGFSILPIAMSNIIGGQILIPAGLEKKLLTAEIIGAVLNIILNFIAIPVWGMNGAAATTVIAEICVTLVTIISVNRYLKLDIFKWSEYALMLICAALIGVLTKLCCKPFEEHIHFLAVIVIEGLLFITLYMFLLFITGNKTLKFIITDILFAGWNQHLYKKNFICERADID